MERTKELPLTAHTGFWLTLAVAAAGAAVIWSMWESLTLLLARVEFALASTVPEHWIGNAAWYSLPVLGFFAGLLASISPCILPLVPLNAAFIGAAEATGLRAVLISARFVLGAALALAILGLLTDLAGTLLVEQRGFVLLAAGLALLLFAAALLELVSLPFSGASLFADRPLGPVAAGAAFALVTTPCASPLLGGLLTAAAASGAAGLTSLAMLSFAVGYTALVFVAGVFGGQAIERLRRRSYVGARALGAAVLGFTGLAFLVSGIRWF